MATPEWLKEYEQPGDGLKPTLKERSLEANIDQSGASATSSEASAGKSVADTKTEEQIRPAKVSKAQSDAELAEYRAKQAKLAWEKTQQMIAGVPKPEKLPGAQQLILNEVRNLSQALGLSRDMFGGSGIGHGVTSMIGGTPASSVEGLLKPVFANEAFTKLAAMRAESPTGAALGNVTEKELDLLKYAEGAADPMASDEVFQQGARDLIGKRLQVLSRLGADPYAVAEAIGPNEIGNFIDQIGSYSFTGPDEQAIQNYIATSKGDGTFEPATLAALMGQAYYNATGRAPDEQYINAATAEAQRIGEQEGTPAFDYTSAWDKQRQQLIPAAGTAQAPGWGDAIGGGAINLAPSVVEFAADTVKALTLDLPDTVEGVASVVGGALGLTDPEALDAVKAYYADRYGTVDGFKTALKTDPASILADVAGLATAGGTIAAKTANLGSKVTKIRALADAARKSEAFAAGAAKFDPLNIAAAGGAKVLSGAKNAGEQLTIGLPSRIAGVTTADTKQAIQAGREGSPQFLEQLRGEGSPTDPMETANSAISELFQARSKDYTRRMARLNKSEAVTFDDLDKALLETQEVGRHKGIDISAAAGVWDEIDAKVAEFRDAGLNTIEDFDALKRAIRNLSGRYGPGTPEAKVAKDVAGAINRTIVDKAPEYARIMKDYRVASDVLSDVQATLSTGSASADTVLNKLRRVASGKGPRGTTVLQLLEQTKSGKGLGNLLAGQAMSSNEVKGLTGSIAPAAAMAGSPEALAGLLLSPRALGEKAYGAGQAIGKVDDVRALAGRYGLDKATTTLQDLQQRYGAGAARGLRVANPALIQPLVDPVERAPSMGDIATLASKYIPAPQLRTNAGPDLSRYMPEAPQGLDLSQFRPERQIVMHPQLGPVYADTGEPVEGVQ